MRQPAPSPGNFPPELGAPIARLGAAPLTALADGTEGDIRKLLDAVPQNIYLVSAEGTLLYLNRVALEYYGLPLEDFVSGAAFQKAVHPDDRERVHAERIAGISAATPFEKTGAITLPTIVRRLFMLCSALSPEGMHRSSQRASRRG